MLSQNKKPKVVLFLPRLDEGVGGGEHRPPLQLLAISCLLVDRFNIVIVDAAVDDHYKELVIQQCDGAICLGVSCMVGYPTYDGAEVAKEVRKTFPELPIVFGGWFPSVMADIFLREGIADVVVRGQGEMTFSELLNAIVYGSSFESILGITYKKKGEIINNPDRPLTNMNDLPPLPYHLVDLDRYIKSSSCDSIMNFFMRYISLNERLGRTNIDRNIEIRTLHYFSSWGCPGGCKYCCSPFVSKRRWTALDPVRIVDEVEKLVLKYHFNILFFTDANFSVSERRVRDFCKELIRRNLKIYWRAFTNPKNIAKYKEETLDLMVQSNCYCLLIGAESGCQKTLFDIGKLAKLEDTEISVNRLMNKGILPFLTYIVGFPGETPKGVEETLEQMTMLQLKYPELYMESYIFFPLPGSAFYASAVEAGYTIPEKIDDFGKINCISRRKDSVIPQGLGKDLLKKFILLRNTLFYWGFNARWEKQKIHFIGRLLQKSAVFRIRNRLFSFPIEFWLFNILKKVYTKVRRMF